MTELCKKDCALIRAAALCGFIEGMPEEPNLAWLNRLYEYSSKTGEAITNIYKGEGHE